MSGNIKNKNITNRFLKIIKNRNILVFLIFFGIASFLWFLNALNKEYTSDFNLTVSIKNLPNNISVIDKSDNSLIITVSGHGYNLLREKIERVKIPLVIDLKNKKNKAVLHPMINNCTKSYILTNDLFSMANQRFGNNIKVVNISPDTLFFDVKQTYSKKIPVLPKINYDIDANYIQYGEIKIQPDSLTVFGPKHIIDTLQSVNTKLTNIGTIGENHVKELNINFLKNLRYSKSSVLIDIPVEKYTETKIEKDITAINIPKDFNIQIIPKTVNIFYKVPLSLFENINKDDFIAEVDYENVQNQEIPISVISQNDNIQITRISPLSIKFLLEKTMANE